MESNRNLKEEIKKDLKELNILKLVTSLEEIGNVVFCGGYIRNK